MPKYLIDKPKCECHNLKNGSIIFFNTEGKCISCGRASSFPSQPSCKMRGRNSMKRKYTRNINKLRRTQGCLTDSVAYFLNIHPENVPYFVYPREGWNDRLKAFFRKHGYQIYWDICKKPPSRGIHIVCGDSLVWKTYSHVVVYKKGKLAYDPNFPSKWSDKRITHRLIIKKLSPTITKE